MILPSMNSVLMIDSGQIFTLLYLVELNFYFGFPILGSESVLQHFVHKVQCRGMFSTHYHRLAVDYQKDPKVYLCSLFFCHVFSLLSVKGGWGCYDFEVKSTSTVYWQHDCDIYYHHTLYQICHGFRIFHMGSDIDTLPIATIFLPFCMICFSSCLYRFHSAIWHAELEIELEMWKKLHFFTG